MNTTICKGTSDKIADICRKAGVQPVFQQKTTWRGLVTRVKGPQQHMDKGVVYQIPCAQCKEVYAGETGADFSFVLKLLEQWKTKVDNEQKTLQIRKFEGLLNKTSNRRRKDGCLDSQKVVRNLSTPSLTESERDVLALGLNFRISPKAVPVVDIIAAIETQLMNYRRKKHWSSERK